MRRAAGIVRPVVDDPASARQGRDALRPGLSRRGGSRPRRHRAALFSSVGQRLRPHRPRSRRRARLGDRLRAPPRCAIVAWIAEAWYAAAHEDSVCDASSGAHARVIGAAAAGPRVFVSRGKHASYFDRGQCKWGCGGDECGDDRAIVASRIVNIGEIDAPLNGATWTQSSRWPMRAKLRSDFDPALRARLGTTTDHVIPLMQHRRGAAGAGPCRRYRDRRTRDRGGSAMDAITAATRAVGRFLRTPRRKNR